MNKIIILSFVFGILMLVNFAPQNEGVSLYGGEVGNGIAASLISGEIDEVPVDVSESIVKWKGTKFLGTGSHEGTVRFSKGILLFDNDRLTGGEFAVDMRSIYNTDIPKDDPIPRRNLTNHLHSDFGTEEFPTASFTISRVESGREGTLQISGNLTIKGVSRSITINAIEIRKREEYTARFVFDRFDWGIGEDGSWLERKVVDAEITLTVHIYCDPSA